MKNQDIHFINLMLDKFVRSIYGIDMYLTKPYGKYVPTVIVYPEKFLLNSPEYDAEYSSLMDPDKVMDIFEEATRYLGVDLKYDSDSRFVVSVHLGNYLEEYIRQIEEFTTDFFKSDYLPEQTRNYFENVTIEYKRVWFNSAANNLELIFKGNGIDKTKIDIFDFMGVYEDEYYKFISSKMTLDPQIKLFFHTDKEHFS
jgi:hypothetical protein